MKRTISNTDFYVTLFRGSWREYTCIYTSPNTGKKWSRVLPSYMLDEYFDGGYSRIPLEEISKKRLEYLKLYVKKLR